MTYILEDYEDYIMIAPKYTLTTSWKLTLEDAITAPLINNLATWGINHNTSHKKCIKYFNRYKFKILYTIDCHPSEVPNKYPELLI